MAGDRIVWTGDNVDEFTEFAERSEFGWTLGSNVYRYRWWHRAVNKLCSTLSNLLDREWVPSEDPTVLEIYPDDSPGVGDPWHWSTARPGDVVDRKGTVVRGS